jgi:tetratricopeptide (TPR) repeat protein
MDIKEMVRAALDARQEPGQVDRLVQRLLATADCRRQILLDNDPRLASIAVCRALLSLCDAERGDDLRRYSDAASAAVAAAEALRTPRPVLIADLRSEAWAELGNCLRARGELASALSAFEVAEDACEAGSGDPLVLARLLFYRATAAQETGKIDEALDLGLEALEIYEQIGEGLQAGRCEIMLAIGYAKLLNWSSAMRHLQNALARSEVGREPEVLLNVVHNFALYLTEMGRPELALQIAQRAAPLYSYVGRGARQRVALTWLRATAHRQLGRPADAARLFDAAAGASLRLGRRYDAALATLEAAGAWLECGQLRKVTRLAESAAADLKRLGSNSGALAAIMVLKSACEASTLTAELLADLKGRLEATPRGAR